MSKTPLFVKIARPTYGFYLRKRYKIEKAGFENLIQEGPHLLLSNHTHILDPFMIAGNYPYHIRWVTGAHLFKNQILKLLLTRLVGAIAKQQGRSDVHTIREISNALKNNEVVGLFPEGTRTWDGEPVGFDLTTAKLVKLFKYPVVILNLEGSYALKPRWALSPRKGEMTIRIVKVITKEEIEHTPLAELDLQLKHYINFSYRQWQQQNRIPYRSKRKAEALEQLLYLCPSCKKGSTITTKKELIECENCHQSYTLDHYDELTCLSAKPFVNSIPEWVKWQKNYLSKGNLPFPFDKGVALQRGIDSTLITLSKNFEILLQPEEIIIKLSHIPKSGMLQGLDSFKFPFKGITSMIINVKGTIEFFSEGQLWRLQLTLKSSPLKYIHWFETLKERELSKVQEGIS